jgi:hypothetical protein
VETCRASRENAGSTYTTPRDTTASHVHRVRRSPSAGTSPVTAVACGRIPCNPALFSQGGPRTPSALRSHAYSARRDSAAISDAAATVPIHLDIANRSICMQNLDELSALEFLEALARRAHAAGHLALVDICTDWQGRRQRRRRTGRWCWRQRRQQWCRWCGWWSRCDPRYQRRYRRQRQPRQPRHAWLTPTDRVSRPSGPSPDSAAAVAFQADSVHSALTAQVTRTFSP